MASIRKKIRLGKFTGQWEAVWREGDTRRVQRTRLFETKQDARDYARRMEEGIESKRVGDPDDQSVFQFLDSWVEGLPHDLDPVELTTQDNYRNKIDILRRELPDLKLRRLNREEIKKAYRRLVKQGGRRRKDRKLSPLTVLHVHRVLHTALEEARKSRLIPDNPADDIEMPSIRRITKPVRPFCSDEVCRMLDAARAPTIRQTHRNGHEKPNVDFLMEVLREGQKTMGQLKAAFVADGRNPNSVSALLVALKGTREVAYHNFYYHPGEAAGRPKGQKQEPENELIVATLLATGIRRGELAGLAFDDNIDLSAATIEITRNVVVIKNEIHVQELSESESCRRTIALPPSVVDLMRAQQVRLKEIALAYGPSYPRKPFYMLPAPGGGPCDPGQITDRMNRLIKRAGIVKVDERGRKISPVHSWRHTSGTSLYAAYKNVKQVQARLGHSTSEITMEVYVHAEDAIDREAAAHFEKLLRR